MDLRPRLKPANVRFPPLPSAPPAAAGHGIHGLGPKLVEARRPLAQESATGRPIFSDTTVPMRA